MKYQVDAAYSLRFLAAPRGAAACTFLGNLPTPSKANPPVCPAPKLASNQMNYGEGVRHSFPTSDSFDIIRPTIELPLGELPRPCLSLARVDSSQPVRFPSLSSTHSCKVTKVSSLPLSSISLANGVLASLRNIPDKYGIIIRLWTNCFYRLLENLRRSSLISKIALEYLQEFIYYAYTFYTALALSTKASQRDDAALSTLTTRLSTPPAMKRLTAPYRHSGTEALAISYTIFPAPRLTASRARADDSSDSDHATPRPLLAPNARRRRFHLLRCDTLSRAPLPIHRAPSAPILPPRPVDPTVATTCVTCLMSTASADNP